MDELSLGLHYRSQIQLLFRTSLVAINVDTGCSIRCFVIYASEILACFYIENYRGLPVNSYCPITFCSSAKKLFTIISCVILT